MRKRRWQSILKLRRAEERMKMRELGRILRGVARIQERLSEIESERALILSRRMDDGQPEITAEREWLRGELLRSLSIEEKWLSSELDALEREVEAKKSELAAASRRRDIAETLCRMAEAELEKRLVRQDVLEAAEFVDRGAVALDGTEMNYG